MLHKLELNGTGAETTMLMSDLAYLNKENYFSDPNTLLLH